MAHFFKILGLMSSQPDAVDESGDVSALNKSSSEISISLRY